MKLLFLQYCAASLVLGFGNQTTSAYCQGLLHLLDPLGDAEETCQKCQAQNLAVAIRNVSVTTMAE